MSERKYKYTKCITLTKKEGAELEAILALNNCANPSQLLKKIVRNECISVPVNAISMPTFNEEQNKIIAEALSATNSADIVELCRKIAGVQVSIIIKQ